MSEEDRISQLPDDVLFHILSFLTTKEAIVTSLLSTRWRLLCSMLPYIDIRCTKKLVRHDHSQLSSRCHYIRKMAAILYRVCSKPIIEYQEKVNAFLGRLRSEYIASFSLHCKNDRCCSRFVEEWVSAMVARKVGKLDIQLGTYKSMEFSFPHLFTSSSIVTLNIKGPIDLYVPSSVYLPNLKSLNIRVNACIPASNAKALISGSPALEFFYLFYYMEHEMRHCFCQQLTMVRHSRGMHFFRDHSLLYNIHVLTENRHFDVILDFEERDLWPNVVTESVYLTSYLNIKQKTFGEILHALSNVKFLSLRCFRNSRHSPIDIIPLFKNLVELKLFIQREDFMSTAFPYHKCPSLEVIEFNIMDSFYGISERYRYRFVGRVKQLDLSIVPVNPKTIEVRNLLGSPPWIDWSIDSVFSRWPFTFPDDED